MFLVILAGWNRTKTSTSCNTANFVKSSLLRPTQKNEYTLDIKAGTSHLKWKTTRVDNVPQQLDVIDH